MSYEVRVWHEDGTLMGSAKVVESTDTWEDFEGNKSFKVYTEYSEVDPRSGYAWQRYVHRSVEGAESYIREWADGYLEWLDENCDCDWPVTEMCGILSDHGYSIQYCRDGVTVAR